MRNQSQHAGLYAAILAGLLAGCSGSDDALVATLGLQYASDAHIAWQLGLESRWCEKDTYFDIPDPDSGGFIGFVVPGIVYTIRTDLLFNTNIKLPAIDNLTGDHEEGAVFTLGLTYDF